MQVNVESAPIIGQGAKQVMSLAGGCIEPWVLLLKKDINRAVENWTVQICLALLIKNDS